MTPVHCPQCGAIAANLPMDARRAVDVFSGRPFDVAAVLCPRCGACVEIRPTSPADSDSR